MKNFEFYNYWMLKKSFVRAAAVAVHIAKGKAARSMRSNWLDAATDAMPELTKAARLANSFGDYSEIDAQIAEAMKAEGITEESIWNIGY